MKKMMLTLGTVLLTCASNLDAHRVWLLNLSDIPHEISFSQYHSLGKWTSDSKIKTGPRSKSDGVDIKKRLICFHTKLLNRFLDTCPRMLIGTGARWKRGSRTVIYRKNKSEEYVNEDIYTSKRVREVIKEDLNLKEPVEVLTRDYIKSKGYIGGNW